MASRARPILGIALATAMSACGPAAGPNPTPDPPSVATAWPTPPSTIRPVETATPQPTSRDALARHRHRWERLGITSYRITLAYGCFCEFGDGRPIKVHVVDGRIIEAASRGEPMRLRALRGFPATVEHLFDYVAASQQADNLDVKYDKELGYPIAIHVDSNVNADDDEFSVDVLRLVPER
jgi:hypothetical protein